MPNIDHKHTISIILIVILSLLSCPTYCQSQQDRIQDLSLIEQFPKDYTGQVYAGYLNVLGTQKSFYYFYFKSLNQQSDDDPIVLWLNGGPGCSSLIAMTSQNGPFKFIPGKTSMQINKYGWNQKANLLYLQSPVGVGFSRSESQADYTSSDTSVAQDNYNALLQFFKKDQTLFHKDFYIAGESYAGIYIPRLAEQLLLRNQQQSQNYKINLRGILIGNACTSRQQCYNHIISRYQVQFMYTRGFIDSADYSQYQSQCVQNQNPDKCLLMQSSIFEKFITTKTNIYNVYGYCYANVNWQDNQLKFMNMQQQKYKEYPLYWHRLGHYLRCADTVGPNSLFNRNQNRQKIHVGFENDTLKWTACSDNISYTMESRAAYSTLLPLKKAGIKIVYYSGDFDAMVPIQGTISWINKFRSDFGAAIKRSWRPWTLKDSHGDDVLAGMIWQLQGIQFYMVKGAGHMVPSDQPQAALQIFHKFLSSSNPTVQAETSNKHKRNSRNKKDYSTE